MCFSNVKRKVKFPPQLTPAIYSFMGINVGDFTTGSLFSPAIIPHSPC